MQPGAAVGELWAAYFDGESGKITSAKDAGNKMYDGAYIY
jgi:hypothetical protein